MRKSPVFALTCTLFLCFAELGEAQIVRVGPGGGVSVRAPFVRVEVGPGGSTYVRAPFTSVNTPGFGRLVPRYESPADRVSPSRTSSRLRPLTEAEFAQGTEITPTQRTATDPTQMDWRALRRHTRTVAGRFENDLRRVADGATWTASLRPGTVRDLLAEDSNRPPDQATVAQLAAILQSYDALADSDGYPQIARLGGFREMRMALGELTSPPRDRQRRMLVTQWTALHRDLNQFETGPTWQEYLELPPALLDGRDDAEPSVQHLEQLLGRYHRVEGPEEYRAIAQLASFQATLRSLADYVKLQTENIAAPGFEPSQPEAIPLPRPLP